MEKRDAKKLLDKYTSGLCTEEEKAMVENWYLILREESAAPSYERIEATKAEVWESLAIHKNPVYRFRYKSYMAIAAALIICLGIATYFSSLLKPVVPPQEKYSSHDFAPGGNRATLTLADGRKITLDDVANGEVARQSGTTITKTADGQLVFQISEPAASKPDGYNTISTPRGGQYQVRLPDGTSVWLNASSSLKFPAVFTGRLRKVELTGEAYFEVAKNPEVPFQVFTEQQKVVVLGTHFNINSYADEADTKTTLFEGSVQVAASASSSTEVLKPGQQAATQNGTVKVSAVTMEDVMAWKNGIFVFDNETLESIMRKVSRWYDISIVYQDNAMRNEVFGGSVSRFENVSEILRMLEITGNVRFKIETDRIIVMKK